MPVYLNKKTKHLYIEFQYKGERVKEHLPKGFTRAKAEAIEIKRKNEILEQLHGISKTPEMTFERFLKEYFGPHIEHHYSPDSFDKAVHVCKAALPFFKGKALRSIKPADIERFQQSRKTLPTMHKKIRQPATVARELSIISKVFSLAVKNDLCDYNPCSRVDKPVFDNVQDRILKREDEQKFFENMHSEWAKDVCRMALYSGLRQNDIMKLTRFEVRLNENRIVLTQGKTKRQVIVMLNSITKEIVERRMTTGTLLFPSPKSGTEKGSVRHAMTRACDRAGIPRITIRDLRRTNVTRKIENGGDLATVAQSVGHTGIRMMPRYVRSIELMQKAADSLVNPATIPLACNAENVSRLKRKG